MGDIQFPNFNALGGLMQMDRQAESDRLSRERLDRHDQWMQQDRADARDLARQGFAEKHEATKRAQLKEAAEWSGHAAQAVLSAPPEQKQAVLDAMLADGQARGYGEQLKNFPKQYSPGMDGQLHFYASKSQEYLKQLGDRPQALPPVGGGGALGGAPQAAPPNRDAFVQMMMPHALEVSRQTGLDPRLVVAQSALETGFGTAAPGNNYFGIKSHGQPGGQTLATTEAGPGGLVPTQDSFRTYGDVGGSAKDYADFIKTNGRYGPVMAAQGLDAQIDAMGKSGYATDPNYAAKLRQIAQTIGGPPPAGGTHPGPQLAQAGGAPVIPQGGGEPGQGGAMTPPGAPSDPVFELRSWVHQNFPGGRPYADKQGNPISDPHTGLMPILMPNGQKILIRPPPKKEEGPKTLEERDRDTVLKGDPSTAEYAAAYAHLNAERVVPNPNSPGGFIRIRPNIETWARKPTFAGANAPQSAIPPEQGGKSVTVEMGHGKPIPGSENETISKNVAAIGTIDKALDMMKNPTADAQPSGRMAGFISRNLGQTGDQIAQEIDPGGVKARAMLADINSQLLLARSGAAVTDGEYKRLIALLPSAADKPEVISQKLQQVRNTYAEILKGQASQYTQKNGFIPHEGAQAIIGGAPASATPATPPPTTGAQGPKMSPEEAAKLPPGTPFIGMDGMPRVRN